MVTSVHPSAPRLLPRWIALCAVLAVAAPAQRALAEDTFCPADTQDTDLNDCDGILDDSDVWATDTDTDSDAGDTDAGDTDTGEAFASGANAAELLGEPGGAACASAAGGGGGGLALGAALALWARRRSLRAC